MLWCAGALDAFFAACAAQPPRQQSALTPSRQSPQQPKARDLANQVALSKEQIRSLALLPWNSGVTAALSSPRAGQIALSPEASEALSRQAKVSSQLCFESRQSNS